MGSRNRAGVKRRLAEIAECSLRDLGVQVAYGWPGDTVETSTLFFAGVEGNSEVAGMQSGQQPKEDRFTVPVLVAVTPFMDVADAEERAELVVRVFDDALRGCQRLKDRAGVIPDGDDPTIFAGVRSAVITSAQGPYASLSQPTQNAPIVGLYQFDIECVSDI